VEELWMSKGVTNREPATPVRNTVANAQHFVGLTRWISQRHSDARMHATDGSICHKCR
jgi:hypothetical protein